jgi:hypothetical protein
MKKATISGEVLGIETTVLGTRYLSVLVDYDSFQGERWVERWTVWLGKTGFEELNIKDWVQIEGVPSASGYMGKDKEGNDKIKASLSLNSPLLITHSVHDAGAFPNDTLDEDDRMKYGTGLAPF